MYWKDEGYLLSKTNFDENSIIIEVFTLEHGKYSGMVYGGSSRKQKRNFQIGNKLLLNWRSKNENRSGYFNTELIKPISPHYFDDRKKTISILSASSLLKILLPERQINKKIYNLFDDLLNNFSFDYWIRLYIYWELSLIKELGFEINFLNNIGKKNEIVDSVEINNNFYRIPQIYLLNESNKLTNKHIKEALIFNKNILIERFIVPNNLKLPIARNVLENYYS